MLLIENVLEIVKLGFLIPTWFFNCLDLATKIKRKY